MYGEFSCRNFIIFSEPIKIAVNIDLSFIDPVMYLIYLSKFGK